MWWARIQKHTASDLVSEESHQITQTAQVFLLLHSNSEAYSHRSCQFADMLNVNNASIDNQAETLTY
jgi:hypothetical protein